MVVPPIGKVHLHETQHSQKGFILLGALSALQTFFRWGDLASKHRAAAAEYGALKREIDELLARHAAGADVLDEDVTRVRERMDTLSRDVPELPQSTWRRARASIRLTKEGEGLGLNT
jgi:hypothetical protein